MADPIATSADYADAMLVARRGKNLIFQLLLLMLLVQLACFFVARYTNVIPTDVGATTRPTAGFELLGYVSAIFAFAGTILPILLAFVLLLIVNIMLVGRLIGVARVTSAFLWCLLLLLLMFPWQAFFGGTTDAADFRLPGMIFTWDELQRYAKFSSSNWNFAVIKWARFVVFPMIALVLLAMVQIKSSRGIRQALGEADPDVTA